MGDNTQMLSNEVDIRRKKIEDLREMGEIPYKDKFERTCTIAEAKEKFIVQEFVEGPSYSVEIIGQPGNYRTYEITEIFVDHVYDCNRAATLHNLSEEKKKQMKWTREDVIISRNNIPFCRSILQEGSPTAQALPLPGFQCAISSLLRAVLSLTQD